MKTDDLIMPAWPAPRRVKSLITTRLGGVSAGPYTSMNPADHVGDDTAAVQKNRALLRAHLPQEPHWLKQVHGTHVHHVTTVEPTLVAAADAAVTHRECAVCVVLTADCLPVLLCDLSGTVVGVAHAGWRGLCAGVLEQTVAAMGMPGANLLAYLGPAIGPAAFEVGAEVRAAFMAIDMAAGSAFSPQADGKYRANLYALARQRLAGVGVNRVFGGEACTFTEADRFYSYRRDGVTGRMAALIWLESSEGSG